MILRVIKDTIKEYSSIISKTTSSGIAIVLMNANNKAIIATMERCLPSDFEKELAMSQNIEKTKKNSIILPTQASGTSRNRFVKRSKILGLSYA